LSLAVRAGIIPRMTETPPGQSPDPDVRATVRPADSVPRRPVAAGNATQMQVLVGPEQGPTNFVLRRFIMGEGGGMPLHTNLVEHQQYVLRGRARIRIGETLHEVARDHTLFIPAGVPHGYEVIEAPFEFICVVPDAPDRITLKENC
jgi:quercetin dioxygenase-like cupin family protein